MAQQLRSLMTQAKVSNPRNYGESGEEYKQRLYTIAHAELDRTMQAQQAGELYNYEKCMAQQPDTLPFEDRRNHCRQAEREFNKQHGDSLQAERGYYSERIEPSRSEGYSRANYTQYHELEYYTVPVKEELMQSKQQKLNRVKERYTRN